MRFEQRPPESSEGMSQVKGRGKIEMRSLRNDDSVLGMLRNRKEAGF